MRACNHFADKHYARTELQRGREPCNAIILYFDERGELVWVSYGVGMWYNYLKHLLSFPECLTQAASAEGVPPEELKRRIAEELEGLEKRVK